MCVSGLLWKVIPESRSEGLGRLAGKGGKAKPVALVTAVGNWVLIPTEISEERYRICLKLTSKGEVFVSLHPSTPIQHWQRLP